MQPRTHRYGVQTKKEANLTEGMESTVQEMAALLRSTETMADKFAKRVQDRMGEPVPHDEILGAMKTISAKQLSMDTVIAKIIRHRN